MPMSKQPLPVAGLALVTDIYLGYTLLMLTSFYQLIAKDRSLLPDDTEEEENQRVIEDKPLTTDEKQGEAYVSLLDPPAFNLPSPFNQPTHAMSGPRFALPPDLATRKGVTVTPEALRFLGRTIETLRKSMHELNAAHGTVQQRFDVQIKELSRQLGKLAQLHDSALDEQDRSESFSERILQAQERQKELLSRSDRILQRLLDSRQPELSTVEKAWFEELDHLQGQVAGDGQLGTLKSRVEKVSSQVRVLKQHSEKLQGGASPEVSKMGKSQLQRVEALLGIECVVYFQAGCNANKADYDCRGQTLEHAKQKVESLQGRLDEVRDLQKH